MTVKELVAALQGLPADVGDMEVLTEGCDCYGKALSLLVVKDPKSREDDYVLIQRHEVSRERS